MNSSSTPNGWRYPLVGGTRQLRFDGISLKPRKLLENAVTPTTTPALACGASVAPALFAGDRVHALLGGFSYAYAPTNYGCTLC
jgi:hypothetical protein